MYADDDGIWLLEVEGKKVSVLLIGVVTSKMWLLRNW